VTTDELKTVIKNLKNKKAPGPDNVTAEIIKEVASNTSFLDQMVNIKNRYVTSGTFPHI